MFVDIIAKVELLEVSQILAFVAADLIQIIFHVGGKLVVNKGRKMVFHQLNYGKSRPAWNQRIAFFEDIVTTQDRVDDRCVSTRAAGPSKKAKAKRGAKAPKAATKSPAKKGPAKKGPATKAATKKAPAKKSPAKKSATKKTAPKKK